MDFTIAIERPDQLDVRQLIDELDAYQRPLYPPESHHGVDMRVLTQPDVRFLVARDEAGIAQGCGGAQLQGEAAELKRMYVRPGLRGSGIGRRLLEALEAVARTEGVQLLRLETGIHQHEALRLYARLGFERCGPFGSYGPDPMSVFMVKRLGPMPTPI